MFPHIYLVKINPTGTQDLKGRYSNTILTAYSTGYKQSITKWNTELHSSDFTMTSFLENTVCDTKLGL